MPSFNEFGFQTALSPQPGANFAACDFKKSSDHASFWRFWFPNRSFGLARRHLGQPILRARPFLGAAFASQRQPHNYGQTWHFAQFLPAKTTASHTFVLYRFCAIAFFVDGFSAATLSIVASKILTFPYISCLRVLYDVNLSDVGYVCLSLPACLVYLPFVSPLLKLYPSFWGLDGARLW